MKKTLKIWSSLILFLFLFPVIIQFLPDGETANKPKLINEPVIVYASNVFEGNKPETETVEKKALLYFTHNHEAYKPVTKEKNGKISVSHQSENIVKFGEKLKTQLAFNEIQTDILPIDNMAEVNRRGMTYHQAYKSIRPYVEEKIKEVDYDIIIDMHRDSVDADKTTAVYKGEKYAKVAFVVGLEHPNHKHNRALAQQIKDEMEKLVPGITRSIIPKGGAGVDGKYNQDLHPSIVLIELGGIGNSEAELNRTVAVIASVIATILSDNKSQG
ncbi:stage II sporulation protein P [Sporosarcina sp. Marseille-Q4063]|uniref:stage II sporulation protein P n=1 Tax=Sporosarcina sp. Marseille-Q4063 TaxID=2810514 RepID=UPI001BB04E1C|nr:stage II sporulation protein P [Sporosarcina sp. Marseille-Q4063]QUW22192.1 stage II sporulation protein P [Sporosarcina sp. Marseille-Q4063]